MSIFAVCTEIKDFEGNAQALTDAKLSVSAVLAGLDQEDEIDQMVGVAGQLVRLKAREIAYQMYNSDQTDGEGTAKERFWSEEYGSLLDRVLDGSIKIGDTNIGVGGVEIA